MLSDTICYMPKNQKIEKAIIMLHGFGSDGNDLISIAPFMAQYLPDTCFYAPNAPFLMDKTVGFKWFDIETDASESVLSHSDYIQTLMKRANESIDLVYNFIDNICRKHTLKGKQVFLMGFSQGGLIALMSGLLYSEVAGIIGASAVPVMINNALPLERIKNKPSILLTHGTDDDVVPFMGMQITQNTLKNIGCTVETHIVPGMGHNIDQSCIMSMVNFIKILS